MQYVTLHCNGYSSGPLFDYINNPVFQELLHEWKYFDNDSDEKVYIDLRDSLGYSREMEKPSRNDSKLIVTIELKSVLTHKTRLRVRGFSNGEYFYMAVDVDLTLKNKTYTIKSMDDDLEA